jgi:hypothetical protein
MEASPLRTVFTLFAATALATAAQPKMTLHELTGFVKVVSNSVGEASKGKVDCLDAKIADELQKSGVAVDPTAKVAFADNVVQVRTLDSMGKLVICADKSLFKEGATIAVVKEDGKPAIYVDSTHKVALAKSGIVLSDTFLKMAKLVD